MKKLWSAAVITAPHLADIMAEALAMDSLSVSQFAPPRKKEARIEALFATKPDCAILTARLSVAAALHGAKPPKIKIAETPKLDWLKKVAGDFPPIRIARWTIFGAQHKKTVKPSPFNLQIDATSAFGTGEHPTTRGCLRMLDWVLKNTDDQTRCLDMGCGSGILAMAWAQATQGKAVGVDLDKESVAVAKENVRINKLRDHVRIILGNGYRPALVKKGAPYDLIMANIFAGPLCDLAKDLKRHLKPGGHAILAGLLNRQAKDVISAHRAQGLRVEKKLVIGEWTILALHRPVRAK
jgi:ribosomal protein L11 methyltransferase